ADVILGRLLGDFNYRPRVEVVSLYTDQVPENDMSREGAARTGVPIYLTIAETLKIPFANGGLDGVIIIGEHGDYPEDERQRKHYPRRRLLEETLEVFDELAICIPIFSDKFLSYQIEDTVWMYEQLKKRSIPFMGGSSIPHTPHVPSYDAKLLESAQELLVVSYSTAIEAYGYHALEVMQSLAERRSGGETGIRAIRTMEGPSVWEAMERQEWPEDLMLEALVHFRESGSPHPKESEDPAVLVIVDYIDGTRGYVIQQSHLTDGWGFAVRCSGGEIVSALCESENSRPFTHFETLTRMIENFIITGIVPFPAERILYSSGMINHVMESLYRKEQIETPELRIAYFNNTYKGDYLMKIELLPHKLSKLPFSQGIRTDNAVYVSGQGGIDNQGRVVGPDIESQTVTTMENIRRVLIASGLDLEHVVKVNVYLSDRRSYEEFNKIYARYFTAPFPARTTIYCDLNYDLLIEIDVIASTT
ncbi:MAG: hypothetical protein K0R67_3347, partial [Paenibacillus sp.]|nr:hypothetical protein [Paenibacillus sp.]